MSFYSWVSLPLFFPLPLCTTMFWLSVSSPLHFSSSPFISFLLSSPFASSFYCPQAMCLWLLASHLAVFCHSPGLLLAPSQPTYTNSDPQVKFLCFVFSPLSAKSEFSCWDVSLVGTAELYITASQKLETKTECLPNRSLADTQIYIHIVGLLP